MGRNPFSRLFAFLLGGIPIGSAGSLSQQILEAEDIDGIAPGYSAASTSATPATIAAPSPTASGSVSGPPASPLASASRCLLTPAARCA